MNKLLSSFVRLVGTTVAEETLATTRSHKFDCILDFFSHRCTLCRSTKANLLLRAMFEKLKTKISSSPAYVKFVHQRDKLAELIRSSLLTFFDAIGPVWTFLFLKTQDSDSDKPSNEISQDAIKTVFISINYGTLSR